jgi:chromosome segregation ATPase
MMLKNEADPEVKMKIEYLYANKHQTESKTRPVSCHPRPRPRTSKKPKAPNQKIDQLKHKIDELEHKNEEFLSIAQKADREKTKIKGLYEEEREKNEDLLKHLNQSNEV